MKIQTRLLIPLTISFFALCSGLQAQENFLDAKAARSLISDQTWQQKFMTGPGGVLWSWKSDGSVCLRTEGKNSKCADTGRWKLDRERLCYELTWWGASENRKSACFRISNQGLGYYNAIKDDGVTAFEFSVAK